MRRCTERLRKLERRLPTPGRLTVLIEPDGPDGEQVRQQAERLRVAGQKVIVIGPDTDALVETFAS